MVKKILATAATIGMICTMAMPVYAAPTVMADGGVFDDAYYTATYPDVVQVFGTDVNLHYQHYKTYGVKEGRQPYAPGTDVNAVITAAQTTQTATPKTQMTAAQIAAQQQAQIINPSEAFVIARLACVPNISGIEAVTEAHDPNGKLHKAGGYTSAVYFSSLLVDQSQFSYESDQSVVGIGTDGGGCVETYSTVKEADARNVYLSVFDGTILSSGSHVVLGTMVIRTSDKLTATQQNEMTQNIMNAMLYVEQ